MANCFRSKLKYQKVTMSILFIFFVVDKIFINVAYEWPLACEWRMADCCSRHLLTVFSGVWQRSLRAEHSMLTSRKNISVLAKHFSVQLFCNHSVRTFIFIRLSFTVNWGLMFLCARHILCIDSEVRHTPSGVRGTFNIQAVHNFQDLRCRVIPIAWFLAGVQSCVQPWH